MTQSKFLPIARHINDTRYWRVRAVRPVHHQGDVQQSPGKPIPMSPWSRGLQIAQYKSNYERIKRTRVVNVYVSDSFNQGIFKFKAGLQDTGFDIELVRLLVQQLPTKMGFKEGDFKLELKPVPWAKLLSTPSKDNADIIISTITKSVKREEQYGIVFSEPYYCTTLSLLYKVGKNVDSIRDTLKEAGLVGVQAKTTGATVLEAFKKRIS